MIKSHYIIIRGDLSHWVVSGDPRGATEKSAGGHQ